MEYHWWILLNNWVVKTQTFQTFTLIYLTPLVYLRLWFWIRLPKLKREQAETLWKSERLKLQRLYTQSGAAYGSVCNLVRASNMSVSKLRQLLHSKPSYTKFTLAACKFKRVKAFAWFKNEICCTVLAYVDKIAKDNNGVKNLVVRQDLFDRTLDAKGMKTKVSKETVRACFTMFTKNNRRWNIWVDKGKQFAREFKKKLCKAVVSETKSAFAEQTKRSLKTIIYRYVEDNGYKYIHKETQIVTTLNSRRNSSIDLVPKNVKSTYFLFILYSKPLREFGKPKCKNGDRVRNSKNDLPFRKGYKLQFTQ